MWILLGVGTAGAVITGLALASEKSKSDLLPADRRVPKEGEGEPAGVPVVKTAPVPQARFDQGE